MRWNPTIALLTLLVLCASPAGAEDEAAPDILTRKIDVARYRVPRAPAGPRISVPTDIIGGEVDPGDGQVWNIEGWATNGTWLPFDEPVLERSAVQLDTVCSLIQNAVAMEQGADDLEIEQEQGGLRLHGPRDLVLAAEKHVPWILRGLAPSVRVDAVLTTGAADSEQRLLALGSATLWPGRWTRVYLQENTVPCAVAWNIEVAEEATTMAPDVVGVREGQELYLRYHPGETLALVEVWAGSVEHLEILRQDLSAIRNVPEANGPGILSFPRSAANRSYAQVLLHASERRHELRWTNEGRTTRLQLGFGAAPEKSAALERADGNSLAFLRAGALTAGLEFSARSSRSEELTERISSRLFEIGAARKDQEPETRFSASAVDGGEILFLETPTSDLGEARELVLAGERGLSARRIGLRLLSVPEAAYRRAALAGALRAGAPLSDEAVAAFREAGAAEAEGAQLSALVGTRAAFRVGHTVPGVTAVGAEIAQRAAGLHPLTSVRFAGLAGDVLVEPVAERDDVQVRATISWARADAGRLELNMRPPMGMAGPREGSPEPVAKRLVSLPLLGGGQASVDARVLVTRGDAREHVVHAHVRGEEVVLLLLRVP